MSLEEFVKWHEKIKPQVEVVFKLLAKPLNDEPEALIKQLEEAEAWNARVGFLLADANAHLDRETLIARPPKEFGTETDRQVDTEAQVSTIRAVRDKLEHTCNVIKQRLILGESLLAYHRQFNERTIQKPVNK